MTVRNLNYHSYQPVSYAVMTDPSIDHMLPQIPLKATFYSRRKKVEGNIFVFFLAFQHVNIEFHILKRKHSAANFATTSRPYDDDSEVHDRNPISEEATQQLCNILLQKEA